MQSYYFLLLLIFLVNFLIYIKFSFFETKYNVFSFPDKLRRFHKKKTSLFGGIFILTNLIISFVYFIFSSNEVIIFEKTYFYINNEYYLRSFFSFLFGSIFFFFLGYLDDKFKLSPFNKLFGSALILFIIILVDSTLLIKILKFQSIPHKIYLDEFSFFFTVLCFLFLNISLNMFDGIDLQAGIYVLIIFVILILNKILIFLIIPIVLGVIFYLYLNYKKKTFFGDSGINILSFIISYIFIKSYNFKDIFYADEIFIILILPSLELIRLSFTRTLSGKNPMIGDRTHIHHCLEFYFRSNTYLVLFVIILSFLPYLLTTFFQMNHFYVIVIYSLFYVFFIHFVKKKKFK